MVDQQAHPQGQAAVLRKQGVDPRGRRGKRPAPTPAHPKRDPARPPTWSATPSRCRPAPIHAAPFHHCTRSAPRP
jgi:hypothetical protein